MPREVAVLVVPVRLRDGRPRASHEADEDQPHRDS
jgi:hypothetical protein